MSNPDRPGQACFIRQTEPAGEKIFVHFNPASLQYSIQNTLDNKGNGNKNKQYVSQSTAKLSMDLTFDTTDDGRDVRGETEKVAKLMEPVNKTPPVVKFDWGAYAFQGMVESYKETLDFFSESGVPLRATINLTLSSQEKVFERQQGERKPEAVSVPSLPGRGAVQVATDAGNPDASRALGAANGLESLRFPGSASLSVSGEVSLKGPVAFASGGGVEVGAFAGLRATTQAKPTSLDVERFLRPQASLTAATGQGASFGIDGRAQAGVSGSVRAEVGANASLNARIVFEED